MAWGKNDENVPRQRTEERPSSLSEPLPRGKLPQDLQKIVDREDDFFDSLYEGQTADSTDTNYRYAAYASRARTILLSAHRYVAYTSDIGESFRPVAHPWLVRGAYGISWAYLIGDVTHEGYKAYCRNQQLLHPSPEVVKQATGTKSNVTPDTVSAMSKNVHIPAIEDWRAVMVQRAVFQSIASMGLPAFTIHSIVRYSGRAMKDVKNARLRTWGPIGLGLAAVPALPYMFDEPVEKATDWLFYNAFKAIGGEQAAGEPKHGHGHGHVQRGSLKTSNEAKKEFSIVHKASTGTSFRNAFLHSLQPLLKAPHHFLVSRPFLLIFGLYSSTYFTANAIDTITSTLCAQSSTTVTTGPTKFLATSAVNMTLCVYKDSHFARMFSTAAAATAAATGSNPATCTIPKISYLLFSLRDSLTIFASFNLPPLIAPHLGPLSAHLPSLFAPLLSTPSSRTNTAQFLAPALMQLVSTPLHLLGLDMFNRQRRLGSQQRWSRVRRDWAVSALARMGRIVPAFGVGGVVNAAARRGLMRKIEA
ncbi:hypothetical protein EPUS_01185 [Endocarpon pusillum Z07020]|uniref:Uncharacterized protein n=1 Tax=Endocarpon pusillum (strain Z07020 / HMAS-L-300199) TaxID=1263415 RepID=U1GB37_ENDPU|nr:uncharacterized protein EPUS_01185 [Endocarpon pusillum Z07020]ERF69228.1 hypothetical protein EPUS_01185 [Endocarpon pusillum Z07020]